MKPFMVDDGWQAECQRAVRMFRKLMQLAGWPQTKSGVITLIRRAPRTPQEIGCLRAAYLSRRLNGGEAGRLRPGDEATFHEVCDYLGYLTTMTPHRRSLLEASIAGVFQGWEMTG